MSDPTLTQQPDVILDNSPAALSIDAVLKEMEAWRIRKGKGMQPIPEGGCSTNCVIVNYLNPKFNRPSK